MREDYSAHGNAWDYFPHDHARSRAYRWGEDGIAGFGDDQLQLVPRRSRCGTGSDPILKERLFGLTNCRGQSRRGRQGTLLLPRRHADAIPGCGCCTSIRSAAFPYARLVEENRRRGTDEPEFELLDTGVFDDDRYFDVEVEYAKAAPDDILMRDRRRPIAAPSRRRCICCRSSGSATPGRGSRASRNRMLRRIARGEIVATRIRDLPRDAAVMRRRARAAVLRQRDQPAAALRRRTPPAISRTASTITSCTATATRSIPAAVGTKARGALHG